MISENFNLITLMPPKTASNSLKSTLESQGVIFLQHTKSKPQIHLKLSEIVENFELENLTNYRIIQIVRNPYLRFVSSFYFIKKIIPNGYNPIFRSLNVSEFIDHLIYSKKTGNFVEAFYGDVNFVNTKINNGSNWGGSRLFDTQSSWNDCDSDVIHFKIEDLADNLYSLNKILGTSITNLHRLNSQNIKTDYFTLLSNENKKKISELFEEDFKKFGYVFK